MHVRHDADAVEFAHRELVHYLRRHVGYLRHVHLRRVDVHGVVVVVIFVVFAMIVGVYFVVVGSTMTRKRSTMATAMATLLLDLVAHGGPVAFFVFGSFVHSGEMG